MEVAFENQIITLDTLKKGDAGVIEEITDPWASLKLIEMGCLPGGRFIIKMQAPFRDPIAIEIAGNLISIGRQEAKTIRVRKQIS
ncbi:MAG: FeoA family protein [Bacteroidetes bacterium]|nr:FeoA family protein [Bacteroidota bacterium]